jgi:chromosome segregation ATPase
MEGNATIRLSTSGATSATPSLEALLKVIQKELGNLERENHQLLKDNDMLAESINHIEDAYNHKISYVLKALDEAGRERNNLLREIDILKLDLQSVHDEKESILKEKQGLSRKIKVSSVRSFLATIIFRAYSSPFFQSVCATWTWICRSLKMICKGLET